MQRVDYFSKYLGMPTQLGRSKQEVFNFILDKIWKKLKGWKEKNLSFAGRSTLIKAVIQAIPTYVMSCFMLPKGLCHQIERLACNFWWGSNTDRKKIHWVSWKKLCKNKTKGGLGFRDTWAFNEALLAKQAWRLVTQPDSLVAKVYRAKYFPHTNLMNAQIGHVASYTWRSILHSRWILDKGCYWTIGDGESTNIWEDKWLPHQNGFQVWSRPQNTQSCLWVKDLINPITHQWDHHIINNLFYPFEATQILQIPLVDSLSRDELTWSGTKEGIYTVKSGYNAIIDWNTARNNQSGSNINNTETLWKNLWKIKSPPKFLNLIWRIINQAIPVKDKLTSKGIRCSPICPRCNKALETIDHVFLRCEWARAVWFGSPMTFNSDRINQESSVQDWLIEILTNTQKESIEYITATIYHIWKARNLLVFQDKEIPVMTVVQLALDSANDYIKLSTQRPQIHSQASKNRTRGHDNIIWSPPARNLLKLNVDAHPCDDGRWGLGLVLRKEDGGCVGAATRLVRGSHETLEGEAMGLKAAMEFVKSKGIHNVVIEMDAQTIVKAVNERRFHRSYWGRIARQGGDFLRQNPSSSIQWTKRAGNEAAHLLANWAAVEPDKD
jgi:ribonuclease HI